jgi:hypothetical protein
MEDSSFNTLPAELRIKIYEYALTFDRVSCRPLESSIFWPERSLKTQLALTRVCKQIRAESQHLPFTLNQLVVGKTPWQIGTLSWSISHLHSLADDVARNIASIPPDLISKSTVLTLDLIPWARSMLRYSGAPYKPHFLSRWVAVKLFFGRLLRTAWASNFLLDITPKDRFGMHPWCDTGEGLPSETDREPRYELQPEIAAGSNDTGPFIVAATFNTSRILATLDRHRDHDRSLCNVTKHGDVILAQIVELDRVAGTVVDRNTHSWNTTGPLDI